MAMLHGAQPMTYSDPSYENILMFKGRKLGVLRIFLNHYHEFFSQKPWTWDINPKPIFRHGIPPKHVGYYIDRPVFEDFFKN
jgi:hypothetical protein